MESTIPWLLGLFVTILLAVIGWMWGAKNRAVANAYKNGLGDVARNRTLINEIQVTLGAVGASMAALVQGQQRLEDGQKSIETNLLVHISEKPARSSGRR